MIRHAFLCSAAAALVLGCGAESPSAPAGPAAPRLASAPKTAVRGIEDLGTFGFDHGMGLEISQSGDVAGRTDLGPVNAPTAIHAVFWSPRTGPIDLGTLGGTNSETRALNEHGTVVGFAQKPGDAFNQRHPVVWRVRPHGVSVTEIGPFAQGQAEDVNDRGMVVGWSAATVTGPPTAFVWTEQDGATPLPPLAGPRSMAHAVTAAGDVAGSSTVGPPFVDHAVVWWRDGTVSDLGTLGGNTAARAINAHGEVAGFGQACPACPQHAFYWSAATGLVDLGTFGGLRSFAFEIDHQGRVTGFYETAGGIRHGFVWTLAGGKVDLPTLGGPSSSTGNINARGELTGRAEDAGGVHHAVIWRIGP